MLKVIYSVFDHHREERCPSLYLDNKRILWPLAIVNRHQSHETKKDIFNIGDEFVRSLNNVNTSSTENE